MPQSDVFFGLQTHCMNDRQAPNRPNGNPCNSVSDSFYEDRVYCLGVIYFLGGKLTAGITLSTQIDF
jgi:hypothetical protein